MLLVNGFKLREGLFSGNAKEDFKAFKKDGISYLVIYFIVLGAS